MDYFEESKNIAYFLLTAVAVICLYWYSLMKKRKLNLLPGPTGFPIFGYLPYLKNNPTLELHRLGKKYGGIYSLYLGRTYAVVVTDFALAKQLLDKASVSDRTDDIFKLMPGGVGFAETCGKEWIEQRRYTMAEMRNLGFGRSDWENLIREEVLNVLDTLEKSKGQPINISKDLSASISNNVLTLVSAKRLPVNHPKRKIIDEGVESFMKINEQTGLISSYPKVFKFFVKLGLLGSGRHLEDMERMNECVRDEIEEIKKDTNGTSYIHKYITEIEKNKQLKLGNFFNEANLIGNVQSLIIAGSDTTKVSLQWLLLAMAAFPDIQRKVKEEVEMELGNEGTVDWVDRNKLPYCHATILEGQRWRTVVPVNLKHRTTEDIVFNEYDIPNQTHVLAVLSAFHNDTKYWKDPDTFRPERFISEDGKAVKEPEGYMPFSSGKRICPGKTVALIEIFHYFVCIIQKFQILPATETMRPDLEGIPGLTLQPKCQPLRFVLYCHKQI